MTAVVYAVVLFCNMAIVQTKSALFLPSCDCA
ncbi:hypothetical protein PAHA111176_21625 [Parendozoicomonas haliclonae]|uniref:Uncharacterized protein n=1 Tax=Parendozoicomonas haliclonae TaxID=1960125 RepID=A0A1X7AQE1_9GAMM|nr:hypothetical protein EHSB41UT_04352 [Parendozoicomonas haliclonae]